MRTDDKLAAALAFLARLLDPEDLGLAVSAEVRDEARRLLALAKRKRKPLIAAELRTIAADGLETSQDFGTVDGCNKG